MQKYKVLRSFRVAVEGNIYGVMLAAGDMHEIEDIDAAGLVKDGYLALRVPKDRPANSGRPVGGSKAAAQGAADAYAALDPEPNKQIEE